MRSKTKVIIMVNILLTLLLFSCTKPSTKIGSQVWMTKNLNASKFRNGDVITEAKTKADWQRACNDGNPVWCYYNFDQKNGRKFGKLYNWFAINDKRGLAPKGWHIPDNNEWEKLISNLDKEKSTKKGKSYVTYDFGTGEAKEYYESDMAGTKMKSKNGWNENGNGTNSSGFKAFPGGGIFLGENDAEFRYKGELGIWCVSFN